MLNKLKKIKPKHILEMLVILISFIPGMILRLIKRDIWIVAENGDDAKDNGFQYFKYALKIKLNDISVARTSESSDSFFLSPFITAVVVLPKCFFLFSRQ